MSDTTRRILIESTALAELPARVPLLPVPGEYEHPLYGMMDLSTERLDRFVANHNARIYQQHIPIDAEHETKLSGALGYLGDAEVAADGSVSAAVEWTARGESLVSGGGYRYVSPEWYEEWADPSTGAVYRDVLIGLAITTRPFFKESALPPLVAREPGHVPDAGGSAQTHATETDRTDTGKELHVELTEAKVNELISTKLTEQKTALESQFGEQLKAVADRLAATEAENVALKNSERMKSFRDEVMGKSDANGTRWFGNVETHIKVMDALSDDDRKVYIEEQRKLAAMVETSGAFAEIGSGHGEPNTSAWSQVEAQAKALREQNPKLTEAQARTEVMNTNKELAARVAAER